MPSKKPTTWDVSMSLHGTDGNPITSREPWGERTGACRAQPLSGYEPVLFPSGMEAGVTPGTAGAGEEWVEGDGMAIDVSQNGVGQGQERSADFEARLQFLEHRVGQMETQMREEMASATRMTRIESTGQNDT